MLSAEDFINVSTEEEMIDKSNVLSFSRFFCFFNILILFLFLIFLFPQYIIFFYCTAWWPSYTYMYTFFCSHLAFSKTIWIEKSQNNEKSRNCFQFLYDMENQWSRVKVFQNAISVFLRYNWHTTLHYFQVYNIMIQYMYTYFVKWSPP